MWIRCGEGEFAFPCSAAGKYMSEWSREALYPAFQWIENTPISNYVSGSMVIVPFAGITHLLSLSLLGGCILMVDMRVLGFGVGSKTAANLESAVRPLLIAAIVGVLLSGFVLFFGQVLRVYSSPPFWVKIVTLVAALVFTFTVRNKLLDDAKSPGVMTKALGVAAVAAWVLIFLLLTNMKAFIAALVVLPALGLMVFVPDRNAVDRRELAIWGALAAAWFVAVFVLIRISLTDPAFGGFMPPDNPALTTLGIVVAMAIGLAGFAMLVTFRTDAVEKRSSVLTYRLAAAASIAMWLTVAVGGRWIAFH